jgi:hypothetical protein
LRLSVSIVVSRGKFRRYDPNPRGHTAHNICGEPDRFDNHPGVDLSDASEEKSQKEKKLCEFRPEGNTIQDNAIQDSPNEDCTIEERAVKKQKEVSRRAFCPQKDS